MIAIGLSDDAIAYRVKSGRLHREHAGVYSVGTPALTPHERAMATVLAAAPSVLSDFAALALWGFVRHWPQTLELTITVGDRRPAGIIVHRRTPGPRVALTRA